ncbi:MAG: hypothetical protein ACLFN8_00280 [Candidatus Woesearchaeota archaeon]
MGFLDMFKKKTPESSFEDTSTKLGLDDDPFKSDPLMDSNSGLNLPQENNVTDDPFKDPFAKQNTVQNPFKKYSNQDTQYEQQNYNNQVQQTQGQEKDIQIIIAKLDALRAEVQTLSHKIDKIEQKQQKKMW